MKLPEGFVEVYAYQYQPVWETPGFRWLLVALVVVAIIGVLAVWWWRRRKKTLELLPHEWALQELAKLSLPDQATKQDIKIFYCAMTAILKRYLQRRFGYPVAAATDEELATFLRTDTVDQHVAEQLVTLLQGAQMIKFANMSSLRTQAVSDKDRALELIHYTKETRD